MIGPISTLNEHQVHMTDIFMFQLCFCIFSYRCCLLLWFYISMYFASVFFRFMLLFKVPYNYYIFVDLFLSQTLNLDSCFSPSVSFKVMFQTVSVDWQGGSVLTHRAMTQCFWCDIHLWLHSLIWVLCFSNLKLRSWQSVVPAHFFSGHVHTNAGECDRDASKRALADCFLKVCQPHLKLHSIFSIAVNFLINCFFHFVSVGAIFFHVFFQTWGKKMVLVVVI